MEPFIPILMGLVHMAVSKTEHIGFSDVNIPAPGTWNRRRHMIKDINDSVGSKALTERHRQINPDDGREQPRDWNEEESRFEPSALTSRSIFTTDDIDGDSLGDLDEDSVSTDELDGTDLDGLSSFLIKLLRRPIWTAPRVIIEEPEISEESREPDAETSEQFDIRSAMSKRSRHFRRYSWKRHDTRYRNYYDYDAAYYCAPSRGDIYHLLVAVDNVRHGNRRRRVRFCERRRTAGGLVTNVRFIGRRK